MSQQGAIKRYTLILEKIKNNQFPSFDTVKEYLNEEGFPLSRRTLQRDFDALRYEFGIEINYNVKKNGYYLNNASNQEYDLFYSFLETSMRMDLINRSFKDQKSMRQFMSLDASSQFRGLNYIDKILDAIIKRKKIEIQHLNFEKKEIKSHILHPFHLKEFENRWYLIAFSELYGNIRTFGVDRIESLSFTNETFTEQEFDAESFFGDMIGVSNITSEPTIVHLQVSSKQFNYLKTLPLHLSQSIKPSKEENFYDIHLFLKPNFELTQKILSMGEDAKVISPPELKKAIADKISLMKNNYK